MWIQKLLRDKIFLNATAYSILALAIGFSWCSWQISVTRVKKPVLSFEKLIIAGVNELVIGGQMLSSDRKHSLLSIIARTGAEEEARVGMWRMLSLRMLWRGWWWWKWCGDDHRLSQEREMGTGDSGTPSSPPVWYWHTFSVWEEISRLCQLQDF